MIAPESPAFATAPNPKRPSVHSVLEWFLDYGARIQSKVSQNGTRKDPNEPTQGIFPGNKYNVHYSKKGCKKFKNEDNRWHWWSKLSTLRKQLKNEC